MSSFKLLLAFVLLALVPGQICGQGATFGLGQNVWSRQNRLVTDTTAENNGKSTTHWFSGAIVDHFHSDRRRRGEKWSQRFHIDSSHWGGLGAPVFLYIGGEGTANPATESLFMYELAIEHQALVIVLEHRFYGESYPVEDMSDDNLILLSSSQALSDLAWFISWIGHASPSLNEAVPPLVLPASTAASPWIAFGGSYPGNLAAWLKLKYPHLVVGSISSSAPVQAEYNYEQYAQVVGTALANPALGGGRKCSTKIRQAIDRLRHLVTSTAPYGLSPSIPDGLLPCALMADDRDLTAYEAEIFGNFQGTVQYNEEISGAPNVRDLCEWMDLVEDPLQGLAYVSQRFSNQSGTDCIASDYQDDVIKPLLEVSFSGRGCASHGNCSLVRQWIYQSCTEFGFFQTTTGPGHPFRSFSSLNINNAGAAICKDAYGIEGLPWVAWSNDNFGGRDLQGTNTTFVNGSMDPWHALGIINSTDSFYNSCTDISCTDQRLNSAEDVVFLSNTAHCRDMRATNKAEPASVTWAHNKIRENVARYIGGQRLRSLRVRYMVQ